MYARNYLAALIRKVSSNQEKILIQILVVAALEFILIKYQFNGVPIKK